MNSQHAGSQSIFSAWLPPQHGGVGCWIAGAPTPAVALRCTIICLEMAAFLILFVMRPSIVWAEARITGIRIGDHGQQVRIVFDLSEPLASEPAIFGAGTRFRIYMLGAVFDRNLPLPRSLRWIEGLRLTTNSHASRPPVTTGVITFIRPVRRIRQELLTSEGKRDYRFYADFALAVDGARGTARAGEPALAAAPVPRIPVLPHPLPRQPALPPENMSPGLPPKPDSHKLIGGIRQFLNDFDRDPSAAHLALYKAVQAATIGNSSDVDRLAELLARRTVPRDYKAFLSMYLPAYVTVTLERRVRRQPVQLLDNTRAPDDDKEPGAEQRVLNNASCNVLLAAQRNDGSYRAELVSLVDPHGHAAVKEVIKLRDGFRNRLTVTGTYTSEVHYPAGLFIQKGTIINPALQSWDGMLIIRPDGRLTIFDIGHLIIGQRMLDIRENLNDYLDLLQGAEENRYSIVQSHLLISNGQIKLSGASSTARFQRRVLFQDSQGRIAIYDSLNDKQTLYETAMVLRDRCNAVMALNLDMGAYDYCMVITADSGPRKCGVLDDATILTNLLSISYNE